MIKVSFKTVSVCCLFVCVGLLVYFKYVDANSDVDVSVDVSVDTLQ